jgi:hypothetical protein
MCKICKVVLQALPALIYALIALQSRHVAHLHVSRGFPVPTEAQPYRRVAGVPLSKVLQARESTMCCGLLWAPLCRRDKRRVAFLTRIEPWHALAVHNIETWGTVVVGDMPIRMEQITASHGTGRSGHLLVWR